MAKETITKESENKYKRVYESEQTIRIEDIDKAIKLCDDVIKENKAKKKELQDLKDKCLSS